MHFGGVHVGHVRAPAIHLKGSGATGGATGTH